MKYVKYCIMFMIGMGILPLVTHAECSYERQAELSRIAGNVQFNYEYDLNQEYKFSVNISNITNDIYVIDQERTVFNASNGTKRYYSGDTVEFTIYSNDQNCRGEEILTKYVNFPVYNNFNVLEECQEYPDFKYCSLWGNYEIDMDTFDRELVNYKNDLLISEKKSSNTAKMTLMDFINENKVILIITAVVILLLVLFLIIKKRQELR